MAQHLDIVSERFRVLRKIRYRLALNPGRFGAGVFLNREEGLFQPFLVGQEVVYVI